MNKTSTVGTTGIAKCPAVSLSSGEQVVGLETPSLLGEGVVHTR
jgi:hypothetical protein